jgi:hypothetical protein
MEGKKAVGCSFALGIGCTLLLWSMALQGVEGKCCGKNLLEFIATRWGTGNCEDGSWGDPCCGVGDCNIFCCNCDNGCRGDRRKRFFSSVGTDGSSNEEETFQTMDEDGDGRVTEEEAINFMEKMGLGRLKHTSFLTYDKNNDGFLSLEEISSGKSG